MEKGGGWVEGNVGLGGKVDFFLGREASRVRKRGRERVVKEKLSGGRCR